MVRPSHRGSRPAFSRHAEVQREIQRGSPSRYLDRVTKSSFELVHRFVTREVEVLRQPVIRPVDARQRGPATEHEFRERFGHRNEDVAENVVILYMGFVQPELSRARPDLRIVDHVLPT